MNKSDIGQQIIFASHLYNTYGKSLLQDEQCANLLFQLGQNIEVTRQEMVAIGLVKECNDCAVNGEGTCFSNRTGQKNDSILLLINLLLGKSLPTEPQDTNRCYFLTGEGCTLRARHVICVNFLCQRLRENIQHDRLIRLQEIAGEEIDSLFILEECIKKKLREEMRITGEKQKHTICKLINKYPRFYALTLQTGKAQ